MYVLAKFQLRILKELLKLHPYKVSATERSICTASIGKIKLQALPKTDVTYK